MNDKEKKEFYIATCKACLIAQAMKSCASCRFNIGLAEEVQMIDPVPQPESVQLASFAICA